MRKFCVKLTCHFALVVAAACLAQNRAIAQATLNAARPQFGSGASANYPATAQPVPQGAPGMGAAQPMQPGAMGYQPMPSYPGGYPAMPTGIADPDKKFGVGDTVSFSIAEDRDTPPVLKRVTDTGEIDFPYIGRVSVIGKNAAQVAAEVKRKLESEYYYRATVNLGLEQAGAVSLGRVYVSGEVRAPGPQELLPGEKATVSAAIIKAGQFTSFANTAKVQLTRRGKDGKPQKFIIDVGAVLKKGLRDKDMELQDNDYIHVPRNWVTL